MHRNRLSILGVTGLISAMLGQSSQAATLATFADPTIGSGPPPFLFTVNTTASTIAGSWSGTGLTLQTINGTFTDVQFTMPPLAYDAGFETGAGLIEFRELDTDLILRITFDRGILDNPFSFGSTEFMGIAEVAFSGPAVEPPGVVDGTETFSFPFTNQTAIQDGYAATAAFTSSGELVPEPSTLAGLAILVLMGARRRMNRHG